MARETKSMTVYYCVGEKSAVICAEIGDRLRDLFAASLSTATLTTLAGLSLWGLHIYCPASESIRVILWIYI